MRKGTVRLITALGLALSFVYAGFGAVAYYTGFRINSDFEYVYGWPAVLMVSGAITITLGGVAALVGVASVVSSWVYEGFDDDRL